MGDIKGFIKHKRVDFKKEHVKNRIKHCKEFVKIDTDKELQIQASRCMDCGIPFCQTGCPVDNIIPDWNDLVYNNKWYEAYLRLSKTNNFPEFTGRVCPAPCENSCTLAINNDAVTIKNIEVSIIEKAFEKGWVNANPPKERSDKSVAVIGSGPAGLACTDQLNQKGHNVTVFEKNEVVGGLLSVGIPDFKMEKRIVERRVKLMKDEGIEFFTNANIGDEIHPDELKEKFDAFVLCVGAEQGRDLQIEGRHLNGIHLAMDFLSLQNEAVRKGEDGSNNNINAQNKNVVVLGGGDTGSDCIGTSIRQGAASVKNFELLSKPPKERSADNPWPRWAFIERTSTSHEEGCARDYGILTKKFSGENGSVKKLHAVRVEFIKSSNPGERPHMVEIPNSEFEIETDLVLLALGFTGPKKNKLLSGFGVDLTERGNIKTDIKNMTNVTGVFAAGDSRRGQSLVVWAINEGRATAEYVHEYLKIS